MKSRLRGYCLTLSDGSSWRITGDRDYIRWLGKLVSILELKECAPDGSPELVFSGMADTEDAGDRLSGAALSQLYPWASDEGWSFCDHKTIRMWYHKSVPDVVCELRNDEDYDIECINMWYSLQPIYQRSICGGGLPFHAGLAELNGQGVLFAAPGDTGKSTCCRRLPDYWKPLCDDESLVVLDKHGKYRAHPFPTWSDYLWKRAENTWNVQYSVPLSGVFFLEQSEADEAIPVGEGEAAILMNESSAQVCEKFWRTLEEADRRDFRRSVFDNACEMAKKIPAFRLRVSLHGRFWEEIEKILELYAESNSA